MISNIYTFRPSILREILGGWNLFLTFHDSVISVAFRRSRYQRRMPESGVKQRSSSLLVILTHAACGNWNKTGSVRIAKHSDVFVQTLLPWKSNEYYTFWVRVAMRMIHIMLSSVACLDVSYFSTLSHKGHDFQNVIEHKMCVLISSTIFVWSISHSKEKWARYDHKNILVFM